MTHLAKEKVESIQRCLQVLRETLQEVYQVAQEYGEKLKSFLEEAEDIKKRLEDEKVVIAFLGEYSAGKSSLINAIFRLEGQNALPVGPTPTTDRVYYVQYGQTRGMEKRGAEADLFLPEPILKGFKVLDVPGTNSIYEEHTRKAKDKISESDFVVFVSNASQPISASQMEFLNDIVKKGVKLLAYVINKIDTIDDNQGREKILNYVKAGLARLGLSNTQILLTSAKNGENLEALKELIFSNSERCMEGKLQVLKNRIYTQKEQIMKLFESIISEYEKQLQRYQKIKATVEEHLKDIESKKEVAQKDISTTLSLLAQNTILKAKDLLKPSVLPWKSSTRKKKFEEMIRADAESSEEQIRKKLEWLRSEYERTISLIGKFLELSRVHGEVVEEFSKLSLKMGELYEKASREAGQRVIKSTAIGAILAGGTAGAVVGAGGVLSAVGKLTLFEPTMALFVGLPAVLVGSLLGGALGGIYSKGRGEKHIEEKLKEYYEELKKEYNQAVEDYAKSVKNEIERAFSKLKDPTEDLQKLKSACSRLKEELLC